MKYLVTILCFSFCMSCETLNQIVDIPLSNADVASGLKEALNLGTGEAVDFLSAKDGFYKSIYKIYLPDEARTVTDKLKVIPGFSNVEDVILEKINRSAEDAAKNVGPIFLNAIKGMSISDAMNILMGEKNAATTFLNNATYNTLYDEFRPVVLASLNKFNAVDYWADAVNTYNKIPLLGDVNPELDDYVVHQALKGMFSLVEKKEFGIREDINQRVTPLLQKVFAKQDGA